MTLSKHLTCPPVEALNDIYAMSYTCLVKFVHQKELHRSVGKYFSYTLSHSDGKMCFDFYLYLSMGIMGSYIAQSKGKHIPCSGMGAPNSLPRACYRPQSRGDYMFGSVRPSVCLSVRLSMDALTFETSESVHFKERSKWLGVQNGCFDRLCHWGRSRF